MYPLTLALLTFVSLDYAMPVDNPIQSSKPNGRRGRFQLVPTTEQFTLRVRNTFPVIKRW